MFCGFYDSPPQISYADDADPVDPPAIDRSDDALYGEEAR
jgi:hypothetical protein